MHLSPETLAAVERELAVLSAGKNLAEWNENEFDPEEFQNFLEQLHPQGRQDQKEKEEKEHNASETEKTMSEPIWCCTTWASSKEESLEQGGVSSAGGGHKAWKKIRPPNS